MPLPNPCGGSWVSPERIGEMPWECDILMAVEPNHYGTRKGVKKVMACFFEPEGVRISNHHIIAHRHCYDLILTCDEEILLKCDNARFFPFGSCWISPEDQARLSAAPKRFFVSSLFGGKDYMPGHKLRREIWNRQREVVTPHEFWISAVGRIPAIDESKNLTIGSNPEAKAVMFDGMFHLAIENCRQPGYFTEKLIDCFRTKTVPIYWGCPDIGRFFDTKGIIEVAGASDAIGWINLLTPYDYEKRRDAIHRNFHAATEFARDVGERMGEAIRRYLCPAP